MKKRALQVYLKLSSQNKRALKSGNYKTEFAVVDENQRDIYSHENIIRAIDYANFIREQNSFSGVYVAIRVVRGV